MAAGTSSITVDQFVAAPPEKVWRGLTEPELLARWWAPDDVAPIVGHRFHLRMPRWGGVACEVLEVEPPETMGPGWRSTVLPRLAELAATLS